MEKMEREFSDKIIRSFSTEDNMLHIGVYDDKRGKLFLVRDGEILDTFKKNYVTTNVANGKDVAKNANLVLAMYDGDLTPLSDGLGAVNKDFARSDNWKRYGITDLEVKKVVDACFRKSRYTLSDLKNLEASHNKMIKICQLVNRDSESVRALYKGKIIDRSNDTYFPKVCTNDKQLFNRKNVCYTLQDSSKTISRIGVFRQVCEKHFDESAGTVIPDVKVVQLEYPFYHFGEIRDYKDYIAVAIDNQILTGPSNNYYLEDIKVGVGGLRNYKSNDETEEEILKTRCVDEHEFERNNDQVAEYKEFLEKDFYTLEDLRDIRNKNEKLALAYNNFKNEKLNLSTEQMYRIKARRLEREMQELKKNEDQRALDDIFEA